MGYGQSWQNVTSLRNAGATYTNSTGKPIEIAVEAGGFNYCVLNVYVQGVYTGTQWSGGSGYTQYETISRIVPPNGTYSVNTTNCGVTSWSELR